MSESAEPDAGPDTAPLIRAFNSIGKASSRESVVTSEDENRMARLNQIKELLIAKPGFAMRTKPSFPIVRRASTAASGRLETVTRILPRLLSLELFNPETDDLDSDSSGVSSPESVGSVISVTSDERYIARKEAEEKRSSVQVEEGISKSNESVSMSEKTKELESTRDDDESCSAKTTTTFEESSTLADSPHEDSSAGLEDDASLTKAKATRDVPQGDPENDDVQTVSHILLESGKSISSQSMRLIKAAANVASSLEDAVGTVIQRKHVEQFPRHSQFVQRRNDNDDAVWSRSNTRAYLQQDRKSASVDLGAYVNESSSDLMRDINRYCQNSSFDYLETCQTSGTASSSLDIADNIFDVESMDTAECWEGCDEAPKETSWIVNEAYDGGDKFPKVVQPELTPKSLCRDQSVFESEFDRKFNNPKQEAQFDNHPESRFSFKYDEMFRFNFASKKMSKVKSDLVSRSNLGSNLDPASDTKKSCTNPEEHNLGCTLKFKPNVIQEEVHRTSTTSSQVLHSNSDDALDFVMVSKTGEFEDAVTRSDSRTPGKWHSSQDGLSVDSGDVADSMLENTTASLSDGSQAESTTRLFTGSTVSLASNPNASGNRHCSIERRRLQERGRSLDETSSEAKRRECLVTTATTNTLSNASSQESLPSDRGGGSITYHQYYHVFREGELDQLINKYVENLHIISSYYDHASWCVVAEKVQVWTIWLRIRITEWRKPNQPRRNRIRKLVALAFAAIYAKLYRVSR